MQSKIVLLGLTIVLSLLYLDGVNADEPVARVTSNVSTSLIINGSLVGDLPSSVMRGSRVCIESEFRYTAGGERYRFERWVFEPDASTNGNSIQEHSFGSSQLSGECIQPTEPGTYAAEYRQEVLFQVNSEAKAYQQSRWVTKGQVVEVDVPEVVEVNGHSRYRFKDWSGGETPFMPANRIATFRPTVLEARWTPEYLVEIEGPKDGLIYIEGPEGSVVKSGNSTAEGVLVSGWYSAGASLVIRAIPHIYDDAGRSRLTFEAWEMIHGPAPSVKGKENPATVIIVKAPCRVLARYSESHLVEARNFQGLLLQAWVQEGEEIDLHAPALVDIISDEERYVFINWEGLDGVGVNDLQLAVDSALSLEAVYERQFMLNVKSPYGASGEGWYSEGSEALVMAPAEPQSMLFFKRQFDGFLGFGDGDSQVNNPVMTIEVDKPMTVTAVYRSEIDQMVLAILGGILAVGVLAYGTTELAPVIYRRTRKPKVQAQEPPKESQLIIARR